MKDFYIALDFNSLEKIEEFIKQHANNHDKYKVGLEICTRYGVKKVLNLFKKYNCSVFLDLKLYDIPNTMVKSLMNIKSLNFDYITFHLSAGAKAIEAMSKIIDPKRLVGVSILTSMEEDTCKKIYGKNPKNKTKDLIQLGLENKITNFVCSGQEANGIKKLDKNIVLFCPGLRLKEGDDTGDQSRVVYIEESKQHDFDFGVIGRTITESKDQTESIRKIKEIINNE